MVLHTSSDCDKTCDCNEDGSNPDDTCDKNTGQCTCLNNNVSGRKCDKCVAGSWNFPGKKQKYFL